MWQLNLPAYKFNIKKKEERYSIFDSQRRKFVVLTPEEWVRQNFIQFLIQEKHYPRALIAVESQLEMNGMKKRCDAIVYDSNMHPLVIIEFKASSVNISQNTFDQVAVYNFKLHVQYFIVSNGLNHYFCSIDEEKKAYHFFEVIPEFNQLRSSEFKTPKNQ